VVGIFRFTDVNLLLTVFLSMHLLATPPYMNLVYANLLASVASNTILFNALLFFQAVKRSI
jgi:hypothetical protein